MFIQFTMKKSAFDGFEMRKMWRQSEGGVPHYPVRRLRGVRPYPVVGTFGAAVSASGCRVDVCGRMVAFSSIPTGGGADLSGWFCSLCLGNTQFPRESEKTARGGSKGY